MFICKNKFGKYDYSDCGLVCVIISETESSKIIPIPLVSVNVTASVIHAVAHVELTQIYVNKEDQPIEATYYFPVDSNGGVSHFCAELEGRTIQGIVKADDEAKAGYEKAIQEGQTAFLGESNKPDIFKVRVGFLKPGSQVKIVIGYVTEVKNEKGSNAIRFFIPTTVAPRYVSQVETATDAKAKELDAMEFSPFSPAPLSILVNVAIQGKIKSIESLTHKVVVEKNVDESESRSSDGNGNWSHAIVKLAGETQTTDMDKDFTLLITPEEVHVPRLYLEKIENSTALMTYLIPSFNLDVQKSELIFVLDRSGSMQGASIDLARKALTLFLHSLPVDCYFNIVGFGSEYQFLFPDSMKYTNESLKLAKHHAKNLEANLGGTEIMQPLVKVFEKKMIPGYLRQVFVITDGQVSSTEMVIGLCQKNAQMNRVFSLGIGDSASHHLVEGISRAGGGTSAFVNYREPIDTKILQQLKNATQPSLTNVIITWIGLPAVIPATVAAPVEVIKEKTLLGYGKPVASGSSNANMTIDESVQRKFIQVPENIPPIFDGSQLVVFGLFSADLPTPTGVHIAADSPDGVLSIEIKVTDNQVIPTNGMIHKLAAIKAIQELEMKDSAFDPYDYDYDSSEESVKYIRNEIISMGCRHGLSSKYTSFVAIDTESKTKSDETWVMNTRKISSQYPRGWHGGYMDRGANTSCDYYKNSTKKSLTHLSGNSLTKCMSKMLRRFSEPKSIEAYSSRPRYQKSVLFSGGSSRDYDPYVESLKSCGRASLEDTVNGGQNGHNISSSVDNFENSEENTLHAVVATQMYNGAFPLNTEFAEAIGIDLEILNKEAKDGGWDTNSWATALGILFLTEKLANLKDSWELVEGKARKWLSSKFSKEMDMLLSSAQKIISSNSK